MGSPFGRGKPNIWKEEDGLSALPKSCGAYRFIHREDKSVVDYIGITNNLYNRMSNHRTTNKQYDPNTHLVHYQTCHPNEWQALMQWEKQKISQHEPHLCKYVGGNGRVPEKYFFEGEEFAFSTDSIENISADEVEEALETRGVLWKLANYFF